MKQNKITMIPVAMIILFLILVWNGCKHEPVIPEDPINPPDPADCDTLNVTYYGSVLPILQANCFVCHSGTQPQYGLDLSDYEQLAVVVNNGALIGAINHSPGYYPMPKGGPMLSDRKSVV